jgi:hypothetical protein
MTRESPCEAARKLLMIRPVDANEQAMPKPLRSDANEQRDPAGDPDEHRESEENDTYDGQDTDADHRAKRRAPLRSRPPPRQGKHRRRPAAGNAHRSERSWSLAAPFVTRSRRSLNSSGRSHGHAARRRARGLTITA